MESTVERLLLLQHELMELCHAFACVNEDLGLTGWSSRLARKVDILTVAHNRVRLAVSRVPAEWVALIERAALRAEEARAQLDASYSVLLREGLRALPRRKTMRLEEVSHARNLAPVPADELGLRGNM